MNAMFVIARGELRRIFLSPLAWTVLALFQLLLGFFFFNLLMGYLSDLETAGTSSGLADYMAGGLYGIAIFVILFLMPLMTMRMFAEERKSGSLTLLFSSPASLAEIVLGKFLALMGFIAVILLLLLAMPLSLMLGTDLDLGRVAAGLLGVLLVAMALGASGLFMSSLTREPTIAAVASFIFSLLVWVLQILEYQQDMILGKLFGYLSLISHFESLRSGVFNTADVAYYVLFTTLFLWLTVQRLDLERN
jgi:ABC-2 type transport system permease protein